MSIRIVAAALGVMVMAAGARAQEPAAGAAAEAAIVAEVAAMRASVDRVADLLERALAHREVDVLLRRIELAERRIAPLVSRVREAESSVEGQREEIQRMAVMRDNAEERLDEAALQGAEAEGADAREMIRQIEGALELSRADLERRTLRLRELEDDLAEARERIAILDERLEELLGE